MIKFSTILVIAVIGVQLCLARISGSQSQTPDGRGSLKQPDFNAEAYIKVNLKVAPDDKYTRVVVELLEKAHADISKTRADEETEHNVHSTWCESQKQAHMQERDTNKDDNEYYDLMVKGATGLNVDIANLDTDIYEYNRLWTEEIGKFEAALIDYNQKISANQQKEADASEALAAVTEAIQIISQTVSVGLGAARYQALLLQKVPPAKQAVVRKALLLAESFGMNAPDHDHPAYAGVISPAHAGPVQAQDRAFKGTHAANFRDADVAGAIADASGASQRVAAWRSDMWNTQDTNPLADYSADSLNVISSGSTGASVTVQQNNEGSSFPWKTDDKIENYMTSQDHLLRTYDAEGTKGTVVEVLVKLQEALSAEKSASFNEKATNEALKKERSEAHDKLKDFFKASIEVNVHTRDQKASKRAGYLQDQAIVVEHDVHAATTQEMTDDQCRQETKTWTQRNEMMTKELNVLATATGFLHAIIDPTSAPGLCGCEGKLSPSCILCVWGFTNTQKNTYDFCCKATRFSDYWSKGHKSQATNWANLELSSAQLVSTDANMNWKQCETWWITNDKTQWKPDTEIASSSKCRSPPVFFQLIQNRKHNHRFVPKKQQRALPQHSLQSLQQEQAHHILNLLQKSVQVGSSLHGRDLLQTVQLIGATRTATTASPDVNDVFSSVKQLIRKMLKKLSYDSGDEQGDWQSDAKFQAWCGEQKQQSEDKRKVAFVAATEAASTLDDLDTGPTGMSYFQDQIKTMKATDAQHSIDMDAAQATRERLTGDNILARGRLTFVQSQFRLAISELKKIYSSAPTQTRQLEVDKSAKVSKSETQRMERWSNGKPDADGKTDESKPNEDRKSVAKSPNPQRKGTSTTHDTGKAYASNPGTSYDYKYDTNDNYFRGGYAGVTGMGAVVDMLEEVLKTMTKAEKDLIDLDGEQKQEYNRFYSNRNAERVQFGIDIAKAETAIIRKQAETRIFTSDFRKALLLVQGYSHDLSGLNRGCSRVWMTAEKKEASRVLMCNQLIRVKCMLVQKSMDDINKECPASNQAHC